MPEETTAATPQEPTQPEKPVPFSERVQKLVEENWSRATEDSTNAEPAAAEQTAPAGSETKADEPKPTTEAATPEDRWTPPTPEQLADKKFWGGLDKAGWERMERDFPVPTSHVKAAIAAGSKIVNEARKSVQQPPADPAKEQPAEASQNAALKEAIRKANSLDDNESAEGLKEIVRLTMREELPQFGLDPVEAKAIIVARTAFATVIADTPEAANLDSRELDAAVESDPALTSLLEAAADLPDQKRVAITAGVMKKAVDAVLTKKRAGEATKQATEQKKVEAQKQTQRKVNSNATVVSNTVVDSPAGGSPKAKRSAEEAIFSMWPAE